jgi:hypothetical protein
MADDLASLRAATRDPLWKEAIWSYFSDSDSPAVLLLKVLDAAALANLGLSSPRLRTGLEAQGGDH